MTTDAPTDGVPIRFGYHGSRLVADRVIESAGAGHAVELVPYDLADPFGALRAGVVDVMVVKFLPREDDVAVGRPLTTDARAVVVAATHPLASHASVSVEEVAGYDAFAPIGSVPGYVWDQLVPPSTPAGRPVRRVRRVGSVPEMMALVAAGAAVHIAMVSMADIVPAGIRVVPIHDLPATPVALAWRRDLRLRQAWRFIVAAQTSDR